MWWIIIIVVFGLIGGIAISISNDKEDKDRLDKIQQNLSSMDDFTPNMKVIGVRNLYTFAVDNEREKVLVMVGQYKRFVKFEDIISVELIEDNNVLMKKSTGRTIGGSIIGSALAGGAGMIVGGLSGSSKQVNLHSSVIVKLLLRNASSPSIEIACFDCRTMTIEGKPVKDGSMEESVYKKGLSDAKRITDTLNVIIDAIDRASNSGDSTMPTTQFSSTADELLKLAQLKEQGILTEEEFNQQKTKLLNGASVSTTKPESKKVTVSFDSDPFDGQVLSIVASEGKLAAVKFAKDQKGIDLAEAKNYVDNLA